MANRFAKYRIDATTAEAPATVEQPAAASNRFLKYAQPDQAEAAQSAAGTFRDLPAEPREGESGRSFELDSTNIPAANGSGDETEAFRSTFLPFKFDPAKDKGNIGAMRAAVEEAKGNPLFWINPFPVIGSLLSARGVELAVPGAITEPLEANSRGIENDYAPGEEGERQRAHDALVTAGAMVGGRAAPKLTETPAAPRWTARAPGADSQAGRAPITPRSAPAQSPQQEALEAAARRGVEIPVGASDSPVVRSVAGVVKDVPVVGQPLVKAGQKAYEQVKSGVKGVADELGGASVEMAGGQLSDDLVGWVKTLSKEEANRLYDPVDAIAAKARAPLVNTSNFIRDFEQQAAESFVQLPTVIKQVKAATQAKNVSYRGLMRLRTEIGDRLSGDITPEPGMSKRMLNGLYASLTDDLNLLLGRVKGGKEAWQSANDAYKGQIAAKRDALTKIVGAKGDATPAQVIDTLVKMAGTKRSADLEKLRTAKEVAGSEAWDALGATVIDRLGETPKGWSLAKFRTDYGKLDESAKSVLFRPEHKAALDDFYKIGGPFEALDRLGNPSGSGRMGAMVTAGVGAVSALPLLLKSAAGGYVLAKVLAKPMAVRALSKYARTAERAAMRPGRAADAAMAGAEQELQSSWQRAGIIQSGRSIAQSVGAGEAESSEEDGLI